MNKNKPVTLTNLTPYQCELLDMVWNLETTEQVEEWLATLSPTDRVMCRTLIQMVMHEIVEDLVVEDLSLANEYLKRFQL